MGIDSIFQKVRSAFGGQIESLIDIETVDDTTTLVSKDGGLMSIININGSKNFIGDTEFSAIVEKLRIALGPPLSKKGHIIQVVMSCDPESISKDIFNRQSGAYSTARSINLDIYDLLEERQKYISQYTTRETVFIVVWTTPTVLNKNQLKELKRRRKETKNNTVFRNAPNFDKAIKELRDTHRAFVSNMVSTFESANLGAWVLPAKEALFEIRMAIDPEMTSARWLPALPGDTVSPLRLKGLDDMSDKPRDMLVWPRIARQVFPRAAEVKDMRTVRIGDRIFRPISMTLGPSTILSFKALYLKIREYGLPVRISWRIEADGLGMIGMKRTFTQALAFASNSNKQFLAAVDKLQERLLSGDTIVKFSMTAVTWAEANNQKLLDSRASLLLQALASWGEGEWTDIVGDPVAGTLSTVPGITKGDVSPPAAAPLVDAISMLPISRPALSWREGSLLLRSVDGKVLPYQPGSSEQNAWLDLTVGGMGGGKSVFGNAKNLALCLAPGNLRLPRLAILDIGPNSAGLVSLLKYRLPEKERHKVSYTKLALDESFSINIFDTLLGCRTPLPFQRNFQKNFLSILATPVGQNSPESIVPQVAEMVIGLAYEKYSDKNEQKGDPKRYVPGEDESIDLLIEEKNIPVDSYTTWWEIVDKLFDLGEFHGAMLAQRYAVPTLEDIVALCKDEAIEKAFKLTLSNGQSPGDYMTLELTSGIREYKIIGGRTKFDFGDTRVIALNLEEVAPKGAPGTAAVKQAGVFYMLGMYVTTKEFYLTKEALPFFPEKYRDYHATRIEEIRADVKHLHFDEYHRTSDLVGIREQVTNIVREGRKWGVVISLISQKIDDFSQDVLDLATGVFVFEGGGSSKFIQQYNISNSIHNVFRRGLRTNKTGAELVVYFATKTGYACQHVVATIGPQELWAFSTTAVDVNLREKMYQEIGPVETLKRLAKRYPGGIQAELERRKFALREMGTLSGDDDLSASVEKQILNEMLSMS